MRLVLVISLDGKLGFLKGEKADLGEEGDRKVLEEALAWADATMIGGGTLRAHKNTCLIKDLSLINKRSLEGRSKQPISIVVSNQKKFPTNWPYFQQPIDRWILTKKVSNIKNTPPIGYSRQIDLKPGWSETLKDLYEQGLSRLVLLGGAELVGSFLKDDQIDELQLTLTPKVIGGSHSWVPQNLSNLPRELATPEAWELSKFKKLSGNELMLNYKRKRQ